jgi:hypothetical protein
MFRKIPAFLTLLILVSLMAGCGSAQPINTNTPVVGAAETAIGEIPPAEAAAIDDLIKMVNDFVTSGDIKDQAEKSLLAKLDAIKQKLTDNDNNAAANQLNAFVNEVQAQLGKKISDTAANALIAKAQQFAAELQSGIPVTGATVPAMTATALPTETPVVAATQDLSSTPASGTTPGAMNLPTPMGDKLEHQVQWDAVVLQIAQAVGITNFDYDLYKLPANTTWDSTLAYYQDKAATAGWGDAPTQTNEIAGGHYAVWSMTTNGKTSYFVVAQMDTSDGSFTLNIFSQ